jgi:hypothetical protein
MSNNIAKRLMTQSDVATFSEVLMFVVKTISLAAFDVVPERAVVGGVVTTHLFVDGNVDAGPEHLHSNKKVVL